MRKLEVTESQLSYLKILIDDAVKALYSICQQIWKIQQWPQDWKESSFHSNPKERQCQRMLKILLINTHVAINCERRLNSYSENELQSSALKR